MFSSNSSSGDKNNNDEDALRDLYTNNTRRLQYSPNIEVLSTKQQLGQLEQIKSADPLRSLNTNLALVSQGNLLYNGSFRKKRPYKKRNVKGQAVDNSSKSTKSKKNSLTKCDNSNNNCADHETCSRTKLSNLELINHYLINKGRFGQKLGRPCLPCRQAKVLCCKVYPCARCVRLGLVCIEQPANSRQANQVIKEREDIRNKNSTKLENSEESELTEEKRPNLQKTNNNIDLNTSLTMSDNIMKSPTQHATMYNNINANLILQQAALANNMNLFESNSDTIRDTSVGNRALNKDKVNLNITSHNFQSQNLANLDLAQIQIQLLNKLRNTKKSNEEQNAILSHSGNSKRKEDTLAHVPSCFQSESELNDSALSSLSSVGEVLIKSTPKQDRPVKRKKLEKANSHRSLRENLKTSSNKLMKKESPKLSFPVSEDLLPLKIDHEVFNRTSRLYSDGTILDEKLIMETGSFNTPRITPSTSIAGRFSSPDKLSVPNPVDKKKTKESQTNQDMSRQDLSSFATMKCSETASSLSTATKLSTDVAPLHPYPSNLLQQEKSIDLLDHSGDSSGSSLTYVLKNSEEVDDQESNKSSFEISSPHFRDFDGEGKDGGEKDFLDTANHLPGTDNFAFLSNLSKRIDNERLNNISNDLDLCDNFFD